ncbi:hypothetical protein ACERIM_01265 [Natrinema sp. H-ect1]|uniref:DUF7266 family protein n=1 Tax=Natrinema sp. H-ect1 TaxID=3242700 RepID=UPI00359D0867
MNRGFEDDERGVSIALTHVLTIAITTVLVAMLITSASTMLETETDRSADIGLETIGERLANEIGNVDRIATGDDGRAERVAVTASHPRTVANSRYTVELRRNCTAPLLDGQTDCLRLTAASADTVAYVPVETTADIENSSASGGEIELQYDGSSNNISITEAR